jgi:hypothetical protein
MDWITNGELISRTPLHTGWLLPRTSQGNLASTFWNRGRWKEAEELFVPVMETRKQSK